MNLQQLIEQYIAFQRTLGKRFDSAAETLRPFAAALGPGADISAVTLQYVKAFLTKGGPITSTYHLKHGILRGFYRYAQSRGYTGSVPLPTVLPKPAARVRPYIYSREELRRLLAAVDSLQEGYRGYRRLEPITLRTIVLLLYGGGLRVSEAMALNRQDVDLERSLVTVRASKFFRSRLVPMGKDLTQVLSAYAARATASPRGPDAEAPFFTDCRGGRVGYAIVRWRFRRACNQAGIRRRTPDRFQPRLHDLRHTFAVERLTSWYREGADVQALLPHLSVYLGHVHLAATQVYLSMTPELLQAASGRFERYAFAEDSHD
jgi:integrase/recombinase XerD